MSSALPIESGQRPSNRWFHFAAAGLLALSIAVQVVRDRGWRPYEPATPVLWFQSGPLLKRISLGFNNVLADIYWMRAVVYYGSERLADVKTRNFDLLDPLLTFVTTLDPHFKVAYRFGAIFLTEAYPNGPGRPDRAIALLERGLGVNPSQWEYMHDIGFVYYWDLHDYPKAAEHFNRAADIPGAPWWLRPIAATTLARGGDRGASRMLWRQIYDTAPDDRGRQAAGLKLQQLDALDQIEALQKEVDQFAQQRGEQPRSWEALVGARLLPGIPVDPGGTPYDLLPSSRVSLATRSTLFPLPPEPGARSSTP